MKEGTPHESPKASPATVWRAYQGVTQGATDEKSLIERYLPLVRNVVDRIRINLPAHIEAEELYSIGIMGLIAAVRQFKPEQQTTFPAYASRRIRGAVLDELRRLDWRPRRARLRARQIQAAITELEQRLGRPVSDEEIRKTLGISGAEYEKWIEEAKPACFVPLDSDASGDHGGEQSHGSLHEVIADQNSTPVADDLERRELHQLVAQKIRELPDIQRKILAMYYFENMRLAEIAAVFNLTESRICQIHAQTILSLRGFVNRVRES